MNTSEIMKSISFITNTYVKFHQQEIMNNEPWVYVVTVFGYLFCCYIIVNMLISIGKQNSSIQYVPKNTVCKEEYDALTMYCESLVSQLDTLNRRYVSEHTAHTTTLKNLREKEEQLNQSKLRIDQLISESFKRNNNAEIEIKMQEMEDELNKMQKELAVCKSTIATMDKEYDTFVEQVGVMFNCADILANYNDVLEVLAGYVSSQKRKTKYPDRYTPESETDTQYSEKYEEKTYKNIEDMIMHECEELTGILVNNMTFKQLKTATTEMDMQRLGYSYNNRYKHEYAYGVIITITRKYMDLMQDIAISPSAFMTLDKNKLTANTKSEIKNQEKLIDSILNNVVKYLEIVYI